MILQIKFRFELEYLGAIYRIEQDLSTRMNGDSEDRDSNFVFFNIVGYVGGVKSLFMVDRFGSLIIR